MQKTASNLSGLLKSRHCYRAALVFLVCLWSMAYTDTSVLAATYYIGPNASDSNSGASESQPFATFSHAISRMIAGDELIVLDGTYSEAIFISKSGTQSSVIAIRAKNDGKAIIDGQGVRRPVYIVGSYITLEGLRAQNSGAEVYDIRGSHNTLRRCTGYNAKDGENYHVFSINYADHALLEDCAGSGVGRYIFLNYECKYNTFRRCFAKWEHYDHANTDPRAGFANYGADHTIMENCISVDCFPPLGWSGRWTDFLAFKQTHNSWNKIETQYNKYYGCIAHNCGAGFDAIGWEGHQSHSEFHNCLISGCKYYTSKNPYAFYVDAKDTVATNITLVDNDPALCGSYMGQGNKWGSNMSFKNFVFLDNVTAIESSFDWSRASLDYACFWNNNSNGNVPNGVGYIYVNPNFDIFNNKPNYCYIPDNSPCKGAGEGGADIGANIIYRYENGELTGKALWPWPMEDRILAEMNYSVTDTFFPTNGSPPEDNDPPAPPTGLTVTAE